MTDELAALICVYEEAELLPTMLASLAGQVDRIVVADGRYRTFPGEQWTSEDDTIGIATEWAVEQGVMLNVIEAPDDGWESEHAKRTALVQHPALELGAQLLVIDADEELHTNRPGVLRDYYGDYQLQVRGVDPTPGFSQAVRMIAWRPGIEYRWHFGIFTRANRALHNQSWDRIANDVARIDHYHHRRSPERVAADKQYERVLVPLERELGAYGGR